MTRQPLANAPTLRQYFDAYGRHKFVAKPIGFVGGKPVFPIAGGAEDEPPADAESGKSAEPRTFTQDELNSILAADRRKVEAQFADYADVKAKADAHDAALEAARSDQEKAVDTARKEGETAAEERANARVVRAEAKAAAGGRFHDPEVAVRLLDLRDVTVDKDGNVPADALKALLDDLAEKHPYLLATAGEKPRPKPDPAQGGGGGTVKGGLVGLSGDELYERIHKKPA